VLKLLQIKKLLMISNLQKLVTKIRKKKNFPKSLLALTKKSVKKLRQQRNQLMVKKLS
jgi:hypothetical protein